MLSLDTYRLLFESNAHKYLNFKSKSPNTLYNPIDYLLNIGGKRIRPSLVFLGSDLHDNINDQTHLMASVVELFHNFTLMHDDIMDDATTRRGKIVVHKKYGLNTAILSGDMMSIMSFDLLIKLNHPRSLELISRFTSMARDICEGQEWDMVLETKDYVDRSVYIDMIRQKTAVLIGYCLYAGSVLGDSNDKINDEGLFRFGENFGVAFQIMDDYLDAFGQVDKVGKKLGGDIIQSKKTILYVLTLEELHRQNKSSTTFIDIYSSTTLQDTEKVDLVLDIFEDYDIANKALQLADNYYQYALNELEQLNNIPLTKKEILNDFAQSINIRTY